MNGNPTQKENRRYDLINELQYFLLSNINYIIYLKENLNGTNSEPSLCDVQRLRVLYSSFMMMLWKDEVVGKDSNRQIFSFASDELLDEIVEIIAEKNNDCWKIGDIVFESSSDVVNTIRNKIAHGDYIINNHNLRLDIEDKTGLIPIDNLVDFTSVLGKEWNKIQSTKSNTQYFVIIPNLKKIENERDIKYAINNFAYIEVIDKPRIGRQRDKQYKKFIDDFTQELKKVDDIHKKEYQDKVRDFLEKFDEVGMEVHVICTDSKNIAKIKEVYNSLKNNRAFLQEKDVEKQLEYIAYLIHEKNTKIAAKENINDGLFLNQKILSELANNPTNKNGLKEILGLNDNLSLMDKINLNKAILTSYLVGFYIPFIYGLDKILNAGTEDHLNKIYESKMFDFSKLDLSQVIPKSSSKLKKDLLFTEQYNKNKKSNQEEIDTYCSLRKTFLNLKNKLKKEENPKNVNHLKSFLISTRETLIEHRKSISKSSDIIESQSKFLNENLEEYIDNRSIIEHIRNSISHGNINMNCLEEIENIEDSIINIKDIHNGVLKFEASLTAKQFETLISGNNFKVIVDYLNDTKDISSLNLESDNLRNTSKGRIIGNEIVYDANKYNQVESLINDYAQNTNGIYTTNPGSNKVKKLEIDDIS